MNLPVRVPLLRKFLEELSREPPKQDRFIRL
jgi:hypothetical protein